METVKLRNMLHIQRKKARKLTSRALLLLTSLVLGLTGFSQRVLYQEEHDNKPYYFGISLGISKTSFHSHLHESFLQQDSIMVAEPMNNGGFSLGLLATLKLNRRFELRFNPQLLFTERNIFYRLNTNHPPDLDGFDVQKKVESVITTFPIHIKFNSDRIGNFRVYLLGGGKFDIDLASNAKSRRSEDMIKIGRFDYGVEAGIGFNFYFPSFILSPEVKFSNGLNNLHERTDNLKYSRVLDGIQSRMIMFTLHIEG
jgi:hypothetical protein